jgi:PAS domain S-box-containing protein
MDRQAAHLLWVAVSLVGMGVMDGVHGLLPFGEGWSWLRHVATLLGGVLLSLVWLPALPDLVRRNRGLVAVVAMLSLGASLFAWAVEPELPSAWLPAGNYSPGATAVNAVGGLGFLVGGAWFARRYRAGGHEDDLALAVYAALFGSAGLAFGFSRTWGPGWWWLHACRLSAYAVVLVASYRMAARSFEALGASAQELERRVVVRTQELEQSQAQLTAITANAPVGIAYVDAGLIMRFANPALEAWCGLPPARIVGRHLRDVIGRGALEERAVYFDRALRGERVRFEGPPPYPTIGPRHSDSIYIPDRDASGAVCGVYVFIIDVTDVREAQIALNAAQAELHGQTVELERLVAERTVTLQDAVEELEGFSYSIAHDMRAPLRAMQGYAQLIGQSEGLDVQGRDFVGRIRASAERMDQLIRDVLDYSRVVRRELPVTTVDAATLLRHIIESYPQLHAPDVSVEVLPPIPCVRANPAALTQVFSNLLSNAVKFVAEGVSARVVVRCEVRNADSERWIRFWVEDNGIGMTEDETARIFGMFQRLSAAGAYAGTGMGLAIVRKAVERMHGRLGVDSQPGRGSRFWFELREPT